MKTKKKGCRLTVLAALLILAPSLPASAEIFKYIDNNGIIHYTDNMATIPTEYRLQLAPYVEVEKTKSAEGNENKSSSNTAPVGVAGGKPEEKVIETKTSLPESAPEVVDDIPAKADEKVTGHDQIPAQSDAIAAEPEAEAVAPVNVEVPSKETIRPEEVKPSKGLPVDGAATDTPSDKINSENGDAAVAAKEIPQTPEKTEILPELNEKRKNLEQKKNDLDAQYQSLLEDRKRLEESREGLGSPAQIESYNHHVQELNDKIQNYKELRQALEAEVEVFNKTIN